MNRFLLLRLLFFNYPNPESFGNDVIQYLCALVFQILLCIQLQTHDYKWKLIFIPIYVYEFVHFLKITIAGTRERFDEERENKVTGKITSRPYKCRDK